MAITSNTNNVTTDARGRTIFSGVTSGIDAKSIVDNIVKARQVQIDKISAMLDSGKTRIAALDRLRAKAAVLGAAMEDMYGKVSYDKSGSVFDRKSLSATTSKRASGPLEATSAKQSQPADIVNVTAANSAAKATHDVEVLAVARAQIEKASFSTSGALGLDGKVTMISSAIVETTRTSGKDVATEIAERINADDVLSARVLAAVVGGALVVTAKTAGETIPFTLADATGGVGPLAPTSAIPASPGTAQVMTWSEAAFSAAGRPTITTGTALIGGQTIPVTSISFSSLAVIDGQEYSLALGDAVGTTLRVTAGAGATPASLAAEFKAQIDSLAGSTTRTGIADGVLHVSADLISATGGGIQAGTQWRAGLATEISVAASDTLGDLRGRINATNEGLPRSGLVASQIAVSAVEHQLLFTTDLPNRHLSVSMNPTAGPSATFSTVTIGKPAEARILFDGALVRRPTNVIDDAVAGVTVKILQAEPQTRIRLEIGSDTGAIAQRVAGFVTAYNDAIRFANEQSQLDPATGTYAATSVLATNGALRDLKAELERIRTFSVGAGGRMIALADLGITVAAASADPLAKGQLQVDDNRLTEVLLTKPEMVRNLFELGFVPDGSDIVLAGFTEKSRDASGTFTLNFASGVPSLAVDGGGTVALTRSGNTYTATGGTIEGLSFIYSGATTPGSQAKFSVRTGLGTQLYFLANRYTRPETGRAAQAISEIDDLNAKRQARIDALRDRLDRQRESLMLRFQKMESTLGRLASVRTSLEQFVQAASKGN